MRLRARANGRDPEKLALGKNTPQRLTMLEKKEYALQCVEMIEKAVAPPRHH